MKKNYKGFLIVVLGIILLLQPLLQAKASLITYIDEFVSMAMLLFYISKILKEKKIKKEEFNVIISIFIISVIGLLGNFFSKYQTDLIPILWDIFSVFKVFFVFLGAIYFIDGKVDKKKVINKLSTIVRILLIFAFVFWGISLFKDIGMNNSEIRYGIKSFDFIYGGAGTFAMYLYLYLLILSIDLKFNNKSSNKIFIFLALFLCLTTLRTRAFAFSVIYLFLFLNITKKKIFKLRWYHIIVGLLLVFMIGYDSMEMYFGNSRTARSAFATTSIKVAKENFPIGTGFATYGTDVAYRYYSLVYYKYNLNNIYGLSKNEGSFAHDTYWPAVIGQFGLIGLFGMIILLKNVYVLMLKRIKGEKYVLLSTIYTISVLSISSIATSTFFHYWTVSWLFLLPLVYDDIEGKKEI